MFFNIKVNDSFSLFFTLCNAIKIMNFKLNYKKIREEKKENYGSKIVNVKAAESKRRKEIEFS